MKNSILTAVFLLLSIFANAQLKGSGKIITKTYDYKNFNQLSLQDLDGKIEIEIGKDFNISVAIDDNLLPILTFEENNSGKELKIFFKNTLKNRKYIEDSNLKIKITMPKIIKVNHEGNSSLLLSNITGTAFKIDNSGNGSAKISGSIDTLEIINTGNGNTIAKELAAKNAKILSSGNGSVSVNVSENLTAKATGNSSIVNYGKAKFDSKSSHSGNAELINRL